MLTRRILCVAAFLFCLLPLSSFAQFAHTQQKQIVDGNGKPFLMRGTNLGNWFMPEGYMWDFEGGPQSAREIEGLVTELLGQTRRQTSGISIGKTTSRGRTSTCFTKLDSIRSASRSTTSFRGG